MAGGGPLGIWFLVGTDSNGFFNFIFFSDVLHTFRTTCNLLYYDEVNDHDKKEAFLENGKLKTLCMRFLPIALHHLIMNPDETTTSTRIGGNTPDCYCFLFLYLFAVYMQLCILFNCFLHLPVSCLTVFKAWAWRVPASRFTIIAFIVYVHLVYDYSSS
jgi:hypothetical protein